MKIIEDLGSPIAVGLLAMFNILDKEKPKAYPPCQILDYSSRHRCNIPQLYTATIMCMYG
jgi:hypothetical protein